VSTEGFQAKLDAPSGRHSLRGGQIAPLSRWVARRAPSAAVCHAPSAPCARTSACRARARRYQLTRDSRATIVRIRPGDHASAFMADDHGIQVSYPAWPSLSATTETLGNVTLRLLARTRQTDHFFRRTFAKRFCDGHNRRFLWEMARPAGLEPATLGLEGGSSGLLNVLGIGGS